jgi:putative Mn2+ efflux pump MntP
MDDAPMTPWTKLASAVAFGIGANGDNLTVGFAYGLRGTRIGPASNLLIAILTTAATLAALAVGANLRQLMPSALPDLVGGVLLVGLGTANIWLERRKARAAANGTTPAERAVTAAIGLGETLALAGALSVNNVGLGFAGGIGGLDYGPVGLSVGLFSILFLWLGQWLSQAIVPRLPQLLRQLPLDGNVLILAVGLAMMAGF